MKYVKSIRKGKFHRFWRTSSSYRKLLLGARPLCFSGRLGDVSVYMSDITMSRMDMKEKMRVNFTLSKVLVYFSYTLKGFY